MQNWYDGSLSEEEEEDVKNHPYYYDSLMEAAYWALRELESTLPVHPNNSAYEWGTAIFRWKNSAGWYIYSFQQPYRSSVKNEWRPGGQWPGEVVAWAHTHPNDTFFSNIDLETADGKRGFIKKKGVMFMVNQTGAYWYDGRMDYLSRDARIGKLWGDFPRKK